MTQDLRDQVLLLRDSAACCWHGLRQLLDVAGQDALPWLERLLSQPVEALHEGRSVTAVFMDGKGRIRADVRVALVPRSTSRLSLELPADEGKLLKLLQMFVIQDDVTLAPAPGPREFLTIAGPASAELLTAVGLEVPQGDSVSCGESGVALFRSRLSGVPGYDLIGDGASLSALLSDLSARGLTEVSRDALDCVRIGQGVPWFPQDLAGEVIPLEALLDDLVSVTKGCYPGQEVVARITNRGQVSRKLVRLTAEGGAPPAPGTELLGCAAAEGKRAGLLTSSCVDPVSGSIVALGYLRRAFWKSGTLVCAGEQTLEVSSLDGD